MPYGGLHWLDRSWEFEHGIENEDVVLYFGASEKVRKIEFIIDSFLDASKNKNGVMLLLVGGAKNDRIRLEKYVEKKKSGGIIKVIKKVSRQDLDHYISMSKFTLSILPPLEIYQLCTPGKLFDSMANGVAVIGNKLDFQNGIIKYSRGGILINYDKNELSASISWMLNNPEEVKRMGYNGQKYILKEWSYELIVNKMIKSYNTLK